MADKTDKNGPSCEEEKSALQLLSEQYAAPFEAYLTEFSENPNDAIPPRLTESMLYSLRAGGKRLRPALCLAAAERCGIHPEKALPMAMSIEFMHTASLIHDDLPCMDDDDYRRNSPTNHKVFGECLALLAGDALMIWSLGYSLSRLAHLGIPNDRVVRAVNILSEAAGPVGMCGGQVLDTDRESQEPEKEFVYRIAGAKTAALIRAALVSGAMLGDIPDTTLQCYHNYGTHLGLAFQIVDDILDVTATREELGKTPKKDEAQNKMTFVSAYGLDEAKRLALEESEKAERSLEQLFPEGDLLMDLARSLAFRGN
ncbi:MAG: polyprenyl synthetase family protein [Synergistaceae bacterium]|jgi:geranylgeranyl diphosphate synthase type II|nr:polyprenyl synthetase family protein [Synergistaceae bacterium]